MTDQNTEQTSPAPVASFSQFGLAPSLLAQLNTLGFLVPTPVQVQAIPVVLAGRDLIAKAQTGTGKTAAFGLPLIQKCLDHPDSSHVFALILSPTRELALQISAAFKAFAPQLKMATLYGGTGYEQQIRDLKSHPQVVIGTPGRVMDHMRKASLDIKHIQCFILDEADKMLNMGFIDDIKWILEAIPSTCQRLMFSATVSREIAGIVNQFLKNPVRISLNLDSETATNVTQYYVPISNYASSKHRALELVIEAQEPDSFVVFTQTKSETAALYQVIRNMGIPVALIHGDIPQRQRESVIADFRNNKIKALVATDIIARGLDVDHITHIINFSLPLDADSYVHRIGRTGRIGRAGVAITFVTPREMRQLTSLKNHIRADIQEMPLPSGADVYKIRLKKLAQKIQHLITKEHVQKFVSIGAELQQDIEPTVLLAACLYEMQKSRPLFITDITPPAFTEARTPRPTTSRFGGSTERREYGGANTERRDYRDRDKPRFGGAREGFGGSRDRESFGGSREGFGGSRDRESFGGAREGFGRSNNDSSTRDRGIAARYRIELGSEDEVLPKSIFSALIKQYDLEGSEIGKIQIMDGFTLVGITKAINPSTIFINGKKVAMSSQ